MTIRPGEYLQIGDGIKLIFTGESKNNMHILMMPLYQLTLIFMPK